MVAPPPRFQTDGFTRTMRCALTSPTRTLDRVAAKKSATGGCQPLSYEIRVRGPIGPTMMEAFPSLTATRSGPDTLLTGSIPDQSALYGVIHQLESLGLQLLDINRRRCGGAGTTGEIT
jgi:hypothetical protein